MSSIHGHHAVAQLLFNIVEKHLRQAQESGLIKNHFVFNAQVDLELLMVHEKDKSNHAVYNLAFDTFQEAADKAMKRAREEMEYTMLEPVLEG
jgi:fructose 1,6-bisphosphatase